jgi:hypothetical protein
MQQLCELKILEQNNFDGWFVAYFSTWQFLLYIKFNLEITDSESTNAILKKIL